MDYFKNAYQYKWSNTASLSGLLLQNYDAAQPINLSFSTPKLHCWGDVPFRQLFQMNVKTTIYRTTTQRTQDGDIYKDVAGTRIPYATFNSGPTSYTPTSNAIYQIGVFAGNVPAIFLRKIRGENKRDQGNRAGSWTDYYTTALPLVNIRPESDDTITFEAEALTSAEIESGKGYKYEIECVADPFMADGMLGYYEAYHNGWREYIWWLDGYSYNWDIGTNEATPVDPSKVKVSATFWHKDMSKTEEGGYFITKGVKYSCYDLLRKALLTCDTHIIDNDTTSLDEYTVGGQPQPSLQHSIVLDEKWNSRLKATKINETIFEGKNLWEVLLQIGYYIHAIPYLEFADDGTDRFVLRFRQLGKAEIDNDNSRKITVFNSNNLSEYFAQYDSYVTNLFSPQNLVEEWTVPKTSDPSYLVSNNTAELQLSYGITELVAFDISLKLPNNNWDTRSALEYVFEKSVYDVLSNEDPYKVSPSKGAALYFTLGDNKIQGLNFVPPSVSAGDLPMALKRILEIVWQGTDIGDIDNKKFNELRFRVKYRTQDNARITQTRPDIENFMKNSEYEKYPHHEQFYGQQDKIVDSERFSANLFGRLIRVGNGIYERQEYAEIGAERESGDLVMINNEPYYVTAVENEYYPDAIFQKVTYSKNFNQLANIVTIPSEPRFYEISERSKVRREVRMLEFLRLSSTPNSNDTAPRFLNDTNWRDFIKRLIFNKNEVTLPNYAWTRFKADKLRTHINSSNNVTPVEKLFPSSLVDRTTENIHPEEPSDHADCIVPLLHFPLKNGIVFEWDMVDNFKAGDFVDDHIYYGSATTDEAYLSMQPMRYVDIFGRADLFSFKLFNKTDWTPEQIQQLPQAVITVLDADSVALVKGGDSFGIALEKDCREEISFNYQISLTHKTSEADGDGYMTFANLFGEKESALKMCFLNAPQSMFDENINLTTAETIADNVQYTLTDEGNHSIKLTITEPDEINLGDVKAIALYEENQAGGKYAYIIKNVATLPDEDKLQAWYIYPVYND